MVDRATSVGVVGLGMMGGGIARSLVDAGLDCLVHDLRTSLRDDPLFDGLWRDSPADLARDAGVVLVVVLDAEQTEDVLFGTGGVVEAAREGLVVGLCSTIAADEVRRLSARGASCGLTVIDIGIAGGPDAAATGSLVTMVGGPTEAVEVAGAVLDAMSTRIVLSGVVGAGMELKLVKNAISFMTMCAVHEGLLLGESLGFPSELVRTIAADTGLVDDFFWFPMTRPSALPMGPDADEAVRASSEHFASIAAKDLGAAIDAADSVAMEHPVMDLARRRAPVYFLLDDASRP